jgi:predicted MFS family arabinose efflux permease
MLTQRNTPAILPSNPDEAASALREWLAVVAVTIGAFAFVTTEFLPVGLLPHIARDFGVLPGMAGLLVTIPGIVAAISAPGLMMAAGRMDRRHVFLLLTTLLLASNVVCALAPNLVVMLIGRALLGAALGGFWTLATAAAGRLVQQKDTARAMSIILTGVGCATVMGVPLGTFIADIASWRASFAATGALVAVALIAQYFLVPSLPSAEALRIHDLISLLRRSHVQKSVLMVGLVFGAHFCAYTYIAPFLLANEHFSMQNITWLLLGFGAIGFVSNLMASSFVARSPRTAIAVVASVLMLALVSLPVFRNSHAGVIAILLVWGACFGALPLTFSMWMTRATRERPEAGSALLVSIVQIAIAAGSFIGGGLVDRFGIPSDLLFGGALAMLGLAVLASFNLRAGNDACCQ